VIKQRQDAIAEIRLAPAIGQVKINGDRLLSGIMYNGIANIIESPQRSPVY
jgi:hypothetical protein